MANGEDVVVVVFSLFSLIGSVVLWFLAVPSIMISIFLSAGITAVVYRFLGGIQGASFQIGALKLGGTIAARELTSGSQNCVLFVATIIRMTHPSGKRANKDRGRYASWGIRSMERRSSQ